MTASLSSALESGAHSVPISSVVGYHYRGYTAGVRMRVTNIIRVNRVRASLSNSGRKGVGDQA